MCFVTDRVPEIAKKSKEEKDPAILPLVVARERKGNA